MYFLIKDQSFKARAIEYINKYDIYPALIQIDKYKKNRSKAQNRLMWLWLGIIGPVHGNTQDEMHDVLLVDCGLFSIKKSPKGVDVPIPHKTRFFNVEQMAAFLNYIKQHADLEEIKIPIPADYDFIMTGKKI